MTNNRQPNSTHCFVCGVENRFGLHLNFFQTTRGEVNAEITLTPEYQGYPGVAHGGIIAAMLDEAAGRSQMGEIDNPRFMYTARLEINYRKTVPVGQPIRLVGRAEKSRGRTATASSAIYNQNGQLLAEGKVLLVDLPADVVAGVDLQALGWKVYVDEDSSN